LVGECPHTNFDRNILTKNTHRTKYTFLKVFLSQVELIIGVWRLMAKKVNPAHQYHSADIPLFSGKFV
jgi:hypothetical protein